MKKRTRKPLAFLLTMLLLLTAGAQVLAETPTEEKQVVSEVLEQTAQKEEGKAEQKAEESQQESVPEEKKEEIQDEKSAEQTAGNHTEQDTEQREGSREESTGQTGGQTAGTDQMQSEETGTDGLKTQTEAAEADEIRTQAAGVTVTLSDSIKTDGCLHAEVTGITDGETVQVKWWKSADKTNGSWTEVTRKKITEDRYNISEDRKSLNVALDGGARSWYKVQILDGEGQVLAETAQPYQIPYYNELRNGDFESPEILNRQSYQPFYDSGADGVVWKTTAKSGKIEFVSADKIKLDGNSGLTHQEQSIQWHKVEAAADVSGGGTQFAELNANESGALYQDVLTTPGATLYWQLSHRARGADSR